MRPCATTPASRRKSTPQTANRRDTECPARGRSPMRLPPLLPPQAERNARNVRASSSPMIRQLKQGAAAIITHSSAQSRARPNAEAQRPSGARPSSAASRSPAKAPAPTAHNETPATATFWNRRHPSVTHRASGAPHRFQQQNSIPARDNRKGRARKRGRVIMRSSGNGMSPA